MEPIEDESDIEYELPSLTEIQSAKIQEEHNYSRRRVVSSGAASRCSSAGDSRHICSHCGRAFGFPSRLRVHLRVHTGIRPYRCGLCGKSFMVSSYLNTHQRTHTGERPFTCHTCDRSFISSAQFRCHNLSKMHANKSKSV